MKPKAGGNEKTRAPSNVRRDNKSVLASMMISAPIGLPSWIGAAWGYLATYVDGLLTKPLADSTARWIDSRRDRKRLRNALYKELGANLEPMHSLLIFRANQINTFPRVEEWERREVYDHALQTQPLTFRELKEANQISDFYMQLQRLRGMDARQQHETIVGLSDWIGGCVAKGRLSRRRLNRAYSLIPQAHRFSHPFVFWVSRRYHQVRLRNTPKDVGSYTFAPEFNKLKQLWTGMPGVPKKYTGPPLVGDFIFGKAPPTAPGAPAKPPPDVSTKPL